MEKTLAYEIAREDRVPVGRKLAYSIGVFAEPLFLGTIGNLLVLFYNAVLGVPAKIVGWVLLAPRAWDAVTDPFVGRWSDGCRSRFGRRRPFILFGGLATTAAYILLWTPPEALGTDKSKVVYLLITGVVFFTAYTTFSIPYGALAIEMSPDYKERTSIMAIRKFFHAGGEMLILTMPWFGATLAGLLGREGDERFSYAAASIMFAALSAFFILITFLGTKERAAADVASEMPLLKSLMVTLSNRLFLRLSLAVVILVLGIMVYASYLNYLFLYYFDNKALQAWYGLYTGIVGIPFALLWWGIANKIGKAHSIFIAQGMICAAALVTWVCFNPDAQYLVFISGTLYALGWSGVLVMAPNIMADITDLDELETGQRREGSFGGVYGFLFKFAVAASTPFLGYGVDWAGFVPELGVNQTADTFFKLRALTAFGAAVFMFAALAILWRFPLTPQRALEVRQLLEERRGKRGAVQ